MDVKTVNENKKFDLLKPIKETGKFAKDLFYYKEYVSNNESAKAYKLPPSIQKHMRFAEYDAKHELFLMDDGRNYASVFEIRGFPTEGRDSDTIESYAEQIGDIINVIDRFDVKDKPYVVQCFINDEPHLYGWYERLKAYGNDRSRGTKLNRVFLEMAKEHMRHLCKEGGAFSDPLTGNDFKGCERVTRMVIYRRAGIEKGVDPLAQMLDLREKIEQYLNTAISSGLTFRRCNDKHYYQWLFSYFHQEVEGYDSVIDYFEDNPFLERVQDKPYGYHFLEQAFGSFVDSDMKRATWQIGSTYHKYVSTIGLKKAPRAGHFSAELPVGRNTKVFKAFFDSMPEGSMLHVTFVCQSEREIATMLEAKTKSANKSTSKDAEKIVSEADYWLSEITDGNYLFPTQVGCFVRGNSLAQVNDRYGKAKAKLNVGGFEVIDKRYDIYALDKFLRFLPGNYDHSFDSHFYASRLFTKYHIANLLPIGYSRSKGTGNPMISRFSRNAETNEFDPIVDISSSPHLLMLGTTGAGKSVSAAEMMLSVMALHKPYLTLLDSGKSNEFLVDFFERMGLSVRRYIIGKIKNNRLPDFSLNPWLETREMVEQIETMERIQALYQVIESEQEVIEGRIKEVTQEVDKQKTGDIFDVRADENESERDYVAEFHLAALLMCADGKEPEEAGITEDHRAELLACVIACAKEVVRGGRDQMIASDLVAYMKREVERLEPSSKLHEKDTENKLRLLIKRLETFLSNPINNIYFNRPAKREKTPDVTYFEFGLWKNDNEANLGPRSLAFVVMMNRTMAEAEARQSSKDDSRFSLFFGDECHVVTTKKVTAASLTQCSKMSRKVGLILWLATQNVKDFNDIAAKMLSMFGFWLCLEMSKSEFEKAMSFVDVSDLERNMVESVHNEKGVYTEAALLSKNFRMLMRCYPFRELLFLAFNEPNEKTARMKVADKYNVEPVEAALLQAQFAKGYNEQEALGIVKRMLAS